MKVIDENTLVDAINYIEQAQMLIDESERKGAPVLYGMGTRLLQRLKDEIEFG